MSFLDKININKKIKNRKKLRENEQERLLGFKLIENPSLNRQNKLYFLLTNAVINALLLIGLIGCFMKSFEVSFYEESVVFASILICILISFVYMNTYLKIAGYVLQTIGIFYFVNNYGLIIRTGFGSIANKFMEFVEKDMDLPIEKRYEVYSNNEKYATTLCVIFIIWMFAIVFNILISETKGFLLVLFITFPIIQIGMYFEQNLELKYFVTYIIGLLTLYVMRNTNHYRMEYKRRKGYLKKEKTTKKKIIFDYVNDGKVSLFILLCIAIMVTSISFVTQKIVKQEKFVMSTEFDRYKEDTRDFTKKLLLVGFWGMLTDKSAGFSNVSNQKLGQLDKVTYNYTTALMVKTASENSQRSIYIKSGNGSVYTDNSWKTLYDATGKADLLSSFDLNIHNVYDLNELINLYGLSRNTRKLEINNIDASGKVTYFAYNTRYYDDINNSINDDHYLSSLQTGWSATTSFDTLKSFDTVNQLSQYVKSKKNDYVKSHTNDNDLDNITNEEKYSEYVKKYYMDVPQDNVKSIENFCKNYGISSGQNDVVEQVIDAFQQDYEYTLMPGKIPRNKDFVNYFLDTSKTGYCTYYASAATLIYRYLGIPSRYAYGYTIGGDTILDAKENNNELIDDWLLEDTDNSCDGKVVTYDVLDNCAHAWVEIYIDGLGWIPVEVTPYDLIPDEESGNSNKSLGSTIVSSIFNMNNINKIKNGTLDAIKVGIGVFICIIVFYLVTGYFIRKKRKLQNKANINFEYLCKCFKFTNDPKTPDESYIDFGRKMVNNGMVSSDDNEKYISIIEKDKFSTLKLTNEEEQFIKNTTWDISNKIFGNLTWYKKIIFKYIKML